MHHQNRKFIMGLIFIFCVSVGVGNWIGSSHVATNHHPLTPTQAANATWTCSMHPQIQSEKRGKCPLCGMDLTPIVSTNADDVIATLQLSKHAEALAEIQVTPVIRKYPTQTHHLSGKLIVDETRTKTISAWFPGRIETLFIDYTGIQVQPHDHMAVIYSPDLLIAQKALIDGRRSNTTSLITSTRQKLRLWGLSPTQINDIETTGQASETLTIHAPIGGTVLEKYVTEGDYVNTGSKIYKIADLTQLWLAIDIYESDILNIHYGQPVTFTTPAYPSTVFKGIITFIDPVVDDQTRVIRVRAVINNDALMLKPEMLAHVKLETKMGKNGVINPLHDRELWVSPMHREAVSDAPGNCPICGMALKPASELGLVDQTMPEKPLVIPDTAPLITGKRAIVYVKTDQPGIYEGREVRLGIRAGNTYIVHDGLEEGEYVVSRGNFKIDAAMQIRAKPSMMQSGHSD
jgi:Cu(I)/Ag(I) efflux system membrane fusion protein